MSDLFDKPIVVGVVNSASFQPRTKNRIVDTYLIWANDAPKNIVKALETRNIKTLESYYKYNPFENLPPPKISTEFKSITGGDEDDEFSLEELDAALDSCPETREKELNRHIVHSTFSSAKDLRHDRSVIVSKDVWVFPEDNLLNFKKKIQLLSGIPVYRQHLWYEQDGLVFSPCYELYIDKQRIQVNIWKLRTAKSFIFGMPVNTEWYANRSKIRVHNSEHSTLLNSIYEKAPGGEWFVTDLNDMMKATRKQFAITIKTDVHMRELIYYSLIIRYWPMITNSVFQMFVANEPMLHNEYPELAFSDKNIKKHIELETSLISNNFLPSPSKYPMKSYIAASNVTTVGEQFSYGKSINLRNMFNNIVLTKTLPYVVCRTFISGRLYTLIKKIKGGRVPTQKQNPRIESIIIMLIIPDVAEVFLHVHSVGSYNVKAKWREDKYITIHDIHKYMISHVNPMLKMLNKMGENVMVRPLTLITPMNIEMVDASVIMIIRKKLSSFEFDNLKLNAQKFKIARIIHISSSDANSISFHLLKGMSNFDEGRFDVISNASNGYLYNTNVTVRQRWESIYIRQKSAVLTNRTADIYIHASGLKDSEYAVFIRYMLQLVHMSISSSLVVPSKDRATKTVSHLKESDPLLYDLKRVYRNKTMYSQICQKPNQPRLVSAPTKKSVKYWNFTTQEPAHYECPTSKYPVLYFKTGVHPVDYCIPCCKKAALTEGSKHEHIYSKCIKDHVYTSDSKNVIKSSYIVSYGKDIEEGRLSRLPESSLDQLFYQQYSSLGKSVDNECIPRQGYYIYGIAQTFGQLQNIGMVASLANALGLELIDFIEKTIGHIVKNKSQWGLIMSGRIYSYFKSAVDFSAAIKMAFITKTEQIEFDLWNDAFIDIARIFWGINIITFVDNGSDVISISLPSNVKHIDEFLSPQYKHMIVITNYNSYLPIYLINMAQYKKDNTMAQTIFENTDKIITVIYEMIKSIIDTQDMAGPADLTRLLNFTDDNKDYEVKTIFVNRKNICYAIMLQISNEEIYVPVIDSLHEHLDIPQQSSRFVSTSYTTTLKTTTAFIAVYNEWAKKNKIALILITKWLLIKDSVIGFLDQTERNYYYIASITRKQATSAHDVPFIRLNYDPSIINEIIENNTPAATKPKEVAQSMYNHYVYQLFVLEFTSVINKARNIPMRQSIQKIIKSKIEHPISLIFDLKQLLHKNVDDYNLIISIFMRFTRTGTGESMYNSLIGYKAAKYTYNDIIGIIEQSCFMFDDIILPTLFDMEIKDLVTKLDEIMKDVVEISTTPVIVESFPVSFSSCQKLNNIEHCANGKLRISKKNYLVFLDILALDIKNPIKRRQLMTPALITGINDFKFTTRPSENIFVST